ncbi:MAG: SAM-dependent methyltransferase [Bdellovibrionia bacterium]
MKTITAYLAPEGFTDELLNELKDLTQITQTFERLILTQGPPVQAHWAQNIWLNPQEIPFESITQATQALKKIQRNWTLYSSQLHRRAQLIADGLPKISSKPTTFPSPLPTLPMGSWTLLDKNLLLASPNCSSIFSNGEIHFQENKIAPPSRAYLKLWEALTITGKAPGPGMKCLDMGSSPGGWTWVLHELGATVLSVDKAPLTPEIAALPRVQSVKRDAFTLDPLEIGPVHWFFSDVICYPQKLLELVLKWLEAGTCHNFICTIKFKGKELSPSDHQAIQAFAAIPESKILHLSHNKHELTWIKLDRNTPVLF